MINNIERSYRDYISKYKTTPNLLFMGVPVFEEYLRNQKFHWSAEFSPKLREHVALGCLIIRVPSNCFGYKFFEFDDLNRNKDTHLLYGSILRIDKIPLEYTTDRIGPSSVDPKATFQREFLDIPLVVLEAFKRYLNCGLKADDVESMANVYQRRLELKYEMLNNRVL